MLWYIICLSYIRLTYPRSILFWLLILLAVYTVSSGPDVSTGAVEDSTPFATGAYNAIIAFDETHCVEVSEGICLPARTCYFEKKLAGNSEHTRRVSRRQSNVTKLSTAVYHNVFLAGAFAQYFQFIVFYTGPFAFGFVAE